MPQTTNIPTQADRTPQGATGRDGWAKEKEMTMEKLTDGQIEQAAKAMHEANKNSPQIWEEMSPHLKEWYRNLTSAAAPYLQMPWEPPTNDELEAATRYCGERDWKSVVSQFVFDRNAALQPKTDDKKRECVLRALHRNGFLHGEYINELADDIAWLDADELEGEMVQAKSDAAICRKNGWNVGTHLVGDEGYGPTMIQITAIGEQNILAREISHNGKPAEGYGYESSWTLCCRDWKEVPR